MESNPTASIHYVTCDRCNKYFSCEDILTEHLISDEHQNNADHHHHSNASNGVKVIGLDKSYNIANLKMLMNSFGKTTSIKTSRRGRSSNLMFQDASAAAALLNAEGLEFAGKKLKVLPWQNDPERMSADRHKPPRRGRNRDKPNQFASEKLGNNDQVTSTRLICFPCKTYFGNKESLTKHLDTEEHKNMIGNQRRSTTVTAIKLKGFEPGIDIPGLKTMMSCFGKILHTTCTPWGKSAIFVFEDTCSAAAVLNAGPIEFGGRKLIVRPWKTKTSQPSADEIFAEQVLGAVEKLCVDRPIEQQLDQLKCLIFDARSTRIGRVAKMLSDINASLSRLYPGLLLHPFGSSVTDLAFVNSDVDLFIEMPFVDQNVIYRVTDKLRHIGHLFTDVVPVLGAKTPLVKFHHVPTGLSCDISFKNCLGVRNSRLLRYYIDLDPRVRQLMIIIKLWARFHGINGRGGVTSYTLVMMVLFHLQHLGIVPPVSELQKSDNLETVDGWVCGFHPAPRKIHFNESIHSLLKSFFKFYSEFKWDKFVVCPLLGKEIAREDLLDPEKFPAEMSPLKAMVCGNRTAGFQSESSKVVCVQDPFALDHNLTRGLIPSKARELINLVIVSAHAVADIDGPQMLSTLLALQLGKDLQAMSERLCKLCIVQSHEDRDTWEARVWCQLVRVFKSVFKLRVTPLIRGRRTVELECRGFHDTIAGRAEAEKILRDEDQDAFMKLSPISRQTAISNRLLGPSVVQEKSEAGDKNKIVILEDMENSQINQIGDNDPETNDELEDKIGSEADGKKHNVEGSFKILKSIDFGWDSGLIDPVDCVPMAQFTARVVLRKNHMLISLGNKGTYGTFMSEFGRFITANLVLWINDELKN